MITSTLWKLTPARGIEPRSLARQASILSHCTIRAHAPTGIRTQNARLKVLHDYRYTMGASFFSAAFAGYSRTDSNCRFRGQNPVCLTSTLREFMRAKGLEPSPLVLETSCLPLAMLSDWLDGIRTRSARIKSPVCCRLTLRANPFGRS